MKERIGVFFGGKSVEHDISVITGMQVLKNLSKRYEVIPIYIAPNNDWFIADNLDDPSIYLNFEKQVAKKKQVALLMGEGALVTMGLLPRQIKLDCAVLCNHGKNGEDGTLQGALTLAGIPYTSCKVKASANCMDKSIAKKLMKNNKINTPKFVDFYTSEFGKNKFKVLENVTNSLNFPLIVKPANLGSSVGIRICEDVESLTSAIENAGIYDEKIIVEEFLQGAKEYACAVVKINDKYLTSEVQEMHKGDIFTFEDKYLSEKEKNQPKISLKTQNKVAKLAMQAYSALECDGVVRVDLLSDETGKLYVNELNTIPGSLAFNLFKTPFRDLLDATIAQAKKQKQEADKDVYEFSSKAIEYYIKLSKQNKYTK